MLSETPYNLKNILIYYIIGIGCLGFSRSAAQTSGGPPDAVPGKCYAKCFIPNQYQIVAEPVAVGAPDERLIADPAIIVPAQERFIVREESRRYIVQSPVLETITRGVMIREGEKRYIVDPPVFEEKKSRGKGEKFTVVPVVVAAVYETVEVPVEISPAYVQYSATNGENEIRQETYPLEPEYEEIKIQNPKYETVYERIEVKAPSTSWVRKPGDPNCLRNEPDDCFIWCLVETPAEFQTISRKANRGCDKSNRPNSGCIVKKTVPAKLAPLTVERVKKAAVLKADTIPAIFRKIKRQVVAKPAYIRYDTLFNETRKIITPAIIREEKIAPAFQPVEIKILKIPGSYKEEITPAEYRTFAIKSLVKPARVRSEPIPPEFTSVNRKRLVRKGGFTEWREIVCGEKLTGNTIANVQQKLKKLGYYKGSVDNKFNPALRKALQKFQQDRGLPMGELTVETLTALQIEK